MPTKIIIAKKGHYRSHEMLIDAFSMSFLMSPNENNVMRHCHNIQIHRINLFYYNKMVFGQLSRCVKEKMVGCELRISKNVEVATGCV